MSIGDVIATFLALFVGVVGLIGFVTVPIMIIVAIAQQVSDPQGRPERRARIAANRRARELARARQRQYSSGSTSWSSADGWYSSSSSSDSGSWSGSCDSGSSSSSCGGGSSSSCGGGSSSC